MSTNLMNGAQIVLECLAREKVEVIFGYPGGVTLPFYDAIYDSPDQARAGAARAERRFRRRKAMRGPPARWACAARLPVPALPTW